MGAVFSQAVIKGMAVFFTLSDQLVSLFVVFVLDVAF